MSTTVCFSWKVLSDGVARSNRERRTKLALCHLGLEFEQFERYTGRGAESEFQTGLPVS